MPMNIERFIALQLEYLKQLQKDGLLKDNDLEIASKAIIEEANPRLYKNREEVTGDGNAFKRIFCED